MVEANVKEMTKEEKKARARKIAGKRRAERQAEDLLGEYWSPPNGSPPPCPERASNLMMSESGPIENPMSKFPNPKPQKPQLLGIKPTN